MIEITNPLINAYAEKWSSEEDDFLKELVRKTHLRTLSPAMLGGPQLGKICFILTRLLGAKSILEIGTFTGYTTLTFAKAMEPEGKIYTIESDKEVVELSKAFFEQSEYGHKIKQHVGDALEIIPTLDYEFDLVFIDASKTQYSTYYDQVIDKLRPGGIILADNVLFYGKVIEEKLKPKIKAIHDFNQKIKSDHRVFNILLPIADGINCILKL